LTNHNSVNGQSHNILVGINDYFDGKIITGDGSAHIRIKQLLLTHGAGVASSFQYSQKNGEEGASFSIPLHSIVLN
jgi:hypothetical protein